MHDFYRNMNLQRIGEVLVRSLWLEKRLIDLLLLKENPTLVDDFNAGVISASHGEARLTWHKNTFVFVISEFEKAFPAVSKADPRHFENLRFLNELRDLLAHGDISFHRNNVLYVSKDSKRLSRFDANTRPTKLGPDDGTRTVNLVEGPAYEKISAVLSDWERIVETLASQFGVDPVRIK
jgi:hypothetical protein